MAEDTVHTNVRETVDSSAIRVPSAAFVVITSSWSRLSLLACAGLQVQRAFCTRYEKPKKMSPAFPQMQFQRPTDFKPAESVSTPHFCRSHFTQCIVPGVNLAHREVESAWYPSSSPGRYAASGPAIPWPMPPPHDL